MRNIDITLAGEKLQLAVTWGASEEICREIVDVMEIGREIDLDERFKAMGIKYEPKFKYTGVVVAQILYIGAKNAGHDITLERLQELVLDHGLVPSREITDRYIMNFLNPKADEIYEAFQSARDKKKAAPSGEQTGLDS